MMKTEFSYPPSFKSGVIFAAGLTLLFSCAAVLLLLLQFHQMPDVVRGFIFTAALLPLLFFRYLYRVYVRLKEKIQVDEDLLVYVRSDGDPVSLSWEQVGRVEEHPFHQRLTVHDLSETIAVPVEYQLEGFDQLRQWILSHTRPLPEAVLGPRIFHPHRLKVQATALLFLFLLGNLYYVCRDIQVYGEVLSYALFISGLIYMLLKNVWSLRIETDHIVLQYPLFKKAVFFKDMASVQLLNEKKHNHALAVVQVVLRNQKKIRLTYFQEGSIAVYRALHDAWKNSS